MALSSCSAPQLIEDSSLTGWNLIDCGGFGQIYKVRHRLWCYDVAIKLLHYDDGSSSSLLREVEMMRQGSNEYVMQVLGVFRGRPPNSGPSAQLGLVMKYMEKGSLASLQQTLHGVTPLPLVFRLAHQVALGINILHSLSPAVLHLDLKPSNVLLDSDLNVKLTDFGLAKFYHSVSRISKKERGDEGGTISYMPPEAFETTYIPTRASDIYSYGILLWSIVTGKQPYAQAKSSIVRFRIPQGDRPSLEEFSVQTAELKGLMELMIKCWEASSTKRPSSLECTTVTEELYQKHKHEILDAVHEVLKKLEQKEQDRLTEQVQRVHIGPASGTPRVEAVNIQDNVPTGRPPVQEMADGLNAYQRVKDPPTSHQANTCHVDPARSSTDNHKAKASSVHPIGASPASPSTARSHQSRAAENSQRAFKQNSSQQFQRQFSSPVTPSICIHFSNVTGVQSGIKNIMYVNTEPVERRRHPTAPPRVNPSSPRP